MILIYLPWPGGFNWERERRGWSAFLGFVAELVVVLHHAGHGSPRHSIRFHR
jgi:hypothetical protein